MLKGCNIMGDPWSLCDLDTFERYVSQLVQRPRSRLEVKKRIQLAKVEKGTKIDIGSLALNTFR